MHGHTYFRLEFNLASPSSDIHRDRFVFCVVVVSAACVRWLTKYLQSRKENNQFKRATFEGIFALCLYVLAIVFVPAEIYFLFF